jgi:hypothetical protein
MKRFILYLVRWQLSTPILWLAVRRLGTGLDATVIANLVGGAIFFWVDKFIFTSPALEVWHVKERGTCDRCGRQAGLWRLVKAKNYDREDAHPVFLCSRCSKEKLTELKGRGIVTSQKRIHREP